MKRWVPIRKVWLLAPSSNQGLYPPPTQCPGGRIWMGKDLEKLKAPQNIRYYCYRSYASQWPWQSLSTWGIWNEFIPGSGSWSPFQLWDSDTAFHQSSRTEVLESGKNMGHGGRGRLGVQYQLCHLAVWPCARYSCKAGFPHLQNGENRGAFVRLLWGGM